MLKLEPVEVKGGLWIFFQLTNGPAIHGLNPAEGADRGGEGMKC